MTVLFNNAKFLRISTIMKLVNESKPLVGSSNTNTSGYLINSIAMAVLFFSPPLIPLTSTPPM